jgi:hypothetical protein
VAIPLPNASPGGGWTPGYYVPPDITPPEVWIGSSKTPSPITVNTSVITLTGTAQDDSMTMGTMSWFNATTGVSGIPDTQWVTDPEGILSPWTYWKATVPLLLGANVITVSAVDASGNVGTASITVTYDPAAQ